MIVIWVENICDDTNEYIYTSPFTWSCSICFCILYCQSKYRYAHDKGDMYMYTYDCIYLCVPFCLCHILCFLVAIEMKWNSFLIDCWIIISTSFISWCFVSVFIAIRSNIECNYELSNVVFVMYEELMWYNHIYFFFHSNSVRFFIWEWLLLLCSWIIHTRSRYV